MPPPATGPQPRRRRLPLVGIGLALLLAAFGAGVIHLFRLRFDVGDVYPPYSTLRSDPLGAKVLYDSLQTLSGLRTARNLRPLPLLGVPAVSPPGGDHGEARFACFYLGADPEDWPYLVPADALHRLEHIAERGGRIILTFQPTPHAPTSAGLDHLRSVRDEPDARKGSPSPPSRPAAEPESEPDLIARWGIDFRRVKAPSGGGRPAATPPPDAGQAVPVRPADGPPVAWHTAVDFQLDSPAARRAGWHALYQREGRPVIVARPYGHAGGELVLVSDTYFLSNEGLHEAAHPELLAALIGPARTVLFDESHFGIREHPNLMTLARRYRLQGALAALGLLAALFVWRNAVSLLPPRPIDALAAGEAPVAGRDAAAGFLNLLRRGVAPRDLPALCVAQWRQHLAPTSSAAAEARHRATPANVARLEEVLAGAGAARPTERRSPAALYREMCIRLRQRDS